MAMTTGWTAVVHAARKHDGQGLSEYALMLGLIALVTVAALTLLGADVAAALTGLANFL